MSGVPSDKLTFVLCPIAPASMAGRATINTFSLDLVSAVPKRVHLRFALWRAMNRITEQRGPVKTGHLFAGTACDVRSNTKKRLLFVIHGNERADRGPLPCIAEASRGLVKETSWERKEDAATQKETCPPAGYLSAWQRSVVSASIPVSAQSKRVSADIELFVAKRFWHKQFLD